MNINYSFLLPKHALDQIQHDRVVHTGVSTSHCWIFDGRSVLVWKIEDGKDARLFFVPVLSAFAKTESLNTDADDIFISVLARNSALTLVVCLASGCLATWLDINYQTDPFICQLSASTHSRINSFSAVSPTASGNSGIVFVGAAGFSDGSWALVQGSPQGLVSRLLNTHLDSRTECKPSMLGKLGSALSWTYTEVFDPSAKFIKRSPTTGQSVIDVHVHPLDSNRYRVLLLTETAVDLWQVTLGARASEQLLWSFQNQTALQHNSSLSSRSFMRVNKAMAFAASYIYIWTQSEGPVSSDSDHSVQRLLLDDAGIPVHDWSVSIAAFCQAHPPAAASQRNHRMQISADLSGSSCVLLGPGNTIVQCITSQPEAGTGAPGAMTLCHGEAHVLSTELDALAVEASVHSGYGNQACCIVLSATYGVVVLSHRIDEGMAATTTGPMSTELAQQVFQLLDSTISQALTAQQQQSNRPLLALVSGLGRRLESLGALSLVSNMEVLAVYSTKIVDMLPKQWGDGSRGNAGHPGASFAEQLSEKGSRHSMLLACLSESGVLHRLVPQVQRVLLDNAEKLEVVTSLLRLLQAYQQQSSSYQGPEVVLLMKVLQHAGQLSSNAAASASSTGEALMEPFELFCARPTLSASAVLHSVSEAAMEVAMQTGGGLTRPNDQSAGPLRSQMVLLAEVLGTAVAASQARRQQVQQSHRLSSAQVASMLSRPGWLECQEAQGSVEVLLQACEKTRQDLAQGQSGQEQLSRSMFGITEVLLSAHAASVAAAGGTSLGDAAAGAAVQRQALGLYRQARAKHVPVLLADALLEEGDAGLGDRLLVQVEELCRQHHCYPQLLTLCRTLCPRDHPGAPLSSSLRLHHYMGVMGPEEGADEKDTFAAYVYQELYNSGQHAELLMLPSQFWPGLQEFLLQYPHLLWMLLLKSGDATGGAPGALMQTAGSCKADFNQHKRLVCLAKLAAHASGATEASLAASRRLQLLDMQQRIGLTSSSQPAMDLPELVDAALDLSRSSNQAAAEAGPLSGGEAALIALEAMSTCSLAERDANRSRWELTWRQLLEATKWSSADNALGDVGELLQSTHLYRGVLISAGCGALGTRMDSEPAKALTEMLRSWSSGRMQVLVVQTLDRALAAAGL
ncbi:hypothetical protein CEUSTIGMA_g5633.t1 [Chlamydomonas eustigma]|uniref:Nucleoporin Nup133/Nup155-like N-terminal domain-containing protein n=1 Tax=Chlamydomonas eustigma TaxID=1157962 RepID=A0A250X539_9CHLO|nr:hypothetical protein CEUSTIGMA_g5633.t1 [Chlamydomonas eustigma]|eukprot:GAX78191.1 hypothetical protein CEUSTIGMA_g5633.t1 [Chlamydomonas eustigma]